MHNKRAFTLLELLMSFGILSCLMLLVIPQLNLVSLKRYQFIYEYLEHQASSIQMHQEEDYIPSCKEVYTSNSIHFYRNGNVNQAQTVTIIENGRNYEFIIELGGGRIVEK